MFGKKSAPLPTTQPKSQSAQLASTGWAMLALTPDYAVMGHLAPTDTPLVGFLNNVTQPNILLTQCQMQALSGQAMAAEATPEMLVPKSALIAIIPRDEAGLRSAALNLLPHGHHAVIYAGPYLIRATVHLPGELPLRNLYNTISTAMLAVTEAEIHCQVPGTKFPDLKTAVLAVNKPLVQLLHPGV